MPKKRKLDKASSDKLKRVLTVRGASERAAHEIWNICHADTDQSVSRGVATSCLKDHLQPWLDATDLVSFDCHDGSQVQLPILDLQRGLETLCNQCEPFRCVLEDAMQSASCLHPILYCDECTAGNVLAQDKARKANLYHLSWLEMWHRLKSPSAWLPIVVVQSECLHAIRGGASKVMLEMLKRLLDPKYEAGVLLQGSLRFRQQRRARFLADYEAVRSIFSFKGSAGIRPCNLCDNVVSAASGVIQIDDYFVGIGASDGLKPCSDEIIFGQVDKLKTCRTKAQLDLAEKSSGIAFDEHSLMFDPVHRSCMPPSLLVYDYMHTYLFNGVGSWEVALFVAALAVHTNVTVEDLRLAVLDDSWQRHKSSHTSRCSKNALLHPRLFSESLYKGQAHQTAALLPLLRYYVETVIAPTKNMPIGYIRSFCTVCNIVSLVREICYDVQPLRDEDVHRLNTLQKKHQELFKIYGVDHKPKHHHRLHLPFQWQACGSIITCDPLESKHQLYKAGIADRQKSTVKDWEAFSTAVLPRMLASSCQIFNKRGLPFWQLVNPVEAGIDDKFFFGMAEIRTSQSCSTHGKKRKIRYLYIYIYIIFTT